MVEEGYVNTAFYGRFGNVRPTVVPKGVCAYCAILVAPAAPEAKTIAFRGKAIVFCNDSHLTGWRQRRKENRAKDEAAKIINLVQELELNCCHTVEEVRHSQLAELKEIVANVVAQIKTQLRKLRRKSAQLINELHSRIQKLLRLLGIRNDFALPMPARAR